MNQVPSLKPTDPSALTEGEFFAMDALEAEYDELLKFLRSVPAGNANAYNLLEGRLDDFKIITENLDTRFSDNSRFLGKLQEWFRRDSQDVFFQSNLFRRTRTWPEGYPGDHVTLEAIYANEPSSETEIGRLLDRYFLSRKIPTAIRYRINTLSTLLNERSKAEGGKGNWLNLACGSCRELLNVRSAVERKIWCVDYDLSTLEYAKRLLSSGGNINHNYEFLRSNALRFVSPERNVERTGQLSTIYSPGLFDYIEDDHLIRLLSGLYRSLAPDGILITSFFDRSAYDTFDTHWLSKWTSFFRRDKDQSLRLLTSSGISMTNISTKKDESGIGTFFIARQKAK